MEKRIITKEQWEQHSRLQWEDLEEVKKEVKECETCKYNEYPIFIEPCRFCDKEYSNYKKED